MKTTQPKGLRTWIEIDTKAVQHNYKLFRSLIHKNTKLMGVVKSNAYGHSHIDFAKTLQKLDVDFLAVDSIVEGLSLRKNGIRTPLLVLGHTLHERIQEASKNNIAIAVSSESQLIELKKKRFTPPLRIHIKIDTGLHRQGFTERDLGVISDFLLWNKEAKRVVIEGIFTHFAQAKDPSSIQYTGMQLKEFARWIDVFHELGYKPIIHAAATGGTIVFPESHFDMVRIGIGMYGIWPDSATKKYFKKTINLKPVLSWKTVISEIKELPRGSRIGYDSTEHLKQDGVVAVCPVGYWHGFPRALSSKGYVLVNGKRAKILGRVSMDMISIEITGIRNVSIGSVVTLIGKDGKDELFAEDIAHSMHASAYELLTRLNPLIKRIYVP
ncbi:alanine racemase [Patescibacteria group bacterium]|nr:MAG: alanine racemase [Patescibacteria group bacterium]